MSADQTRSQTSLEPQSRPQRDSVRRKMGGVLSVLLVVAFVEWFVLSARR